MRMQDIRKLNRDELKQKYSILYAKLYNLNIRTNDEGFLPHKYKLYKKTIARILTRLKEMGDNNDK